MSKHTPGPWKAMDSSCDGTLFDVRCNPDGEIGEYSPSLAWVSPNLYCDATGDVVEANANLMAAAPDMLEALEMVVESCAIDVNEYDTVKAAIDKARGGEQ